jgi:hypothetical protein
MEQTLVVKGNIYSVIRDENEIPTRVSRLKNNLTTLGRFLFGAWMVKHCNYYVTGGDVSSVLSGLYLIHADDTDYKYTYVCFPQISSIALTNTSTSSVDSGIYTEVGSESFGFYSSTSYGGSYNWITLWNEVYPTTSFVYIPPSAILALMPVKGYGVDYIPPNSGEGVAVISLSTSGSTIIVKVKGSYNFNSNVSVSYLRLLVDLKWRQWTNLETVNPLTSSMNRAFADVFSRVFSASFSSGQKITVTWQVNISGS